MADHKSPSGPREPDADELARAAAGGDSYALDQLLGLIDREGLARPSIKRLVIGEADVDDVHQDVLIAVAETIENFRADAKFTTWLFQVARFKAIAHLRRQRDERTLPEEESDGHRISSMLATRKTVQDALDQLPAKYREPVVLRDLEQRSYDDIGARLDLNTNTARSRVARGRALVAAELRKDSR